ncbi:MAG: HAD family hydrolase [Prevotella sp.]|nr:HAD family hydrolase [Prevotella sp.]
MVKAIIFDFGGTLDTHGDHWSKVMWRAYLNNGILQETLVDDFRKAYVYAERTLGNGHIIRSNYTFKLTLDVKIRLQLEYLITHQVLEITDKKIFQDIHTQLHQQLYADVLQTVGKSREYLIPIVTQYPTALVTNFYGNMQMVLREMHIDMFFQHVVESAVVGIRKPDPAIFQLAIDQLGVSPEDILVVGDSMKNDILPAKQCGCQTCWFKGEGWEESQENTAVFTITDISQLKDIVLA